MLRASAYIVVCSARNRLRVRLRRLREPRYLIGAVAGVVYLYFAVFARIAASRRGRRRGGGPAPAIFAGPWQAIGTATASVGLLALAVLAWVLPASGTLLEFSEAETHILFPAPVTRRELLFHRLIRSQIGFLFASFVAAFFVAVPQASAGSWLDSAGARLLRLFAFWIVFLTLRVYLAGVTLARAHLGARDLRVRAVAWAPLVTILAAAGVVSAALGRSFVQRPPVTFLGTVTRVVDVTAEGWPRLVLIPFVSLIRPLFSPWPGPYLAAFAAAVTVMLIALEWVLRTDGVFQEGRAALQAQAPPAQRSAKRPQVRAARWLLGLSGPTEPVFFWKNGMQTLRSTNLAQVLPFLVPMTVLTIIGVTARMSATHSRGPAAGLAIASLALAGFFTLLGPQAMRSDLRGDLLHLDVLKTWPVKAAAVIRGELLWPTTLLTACAWLAMGCATILSAAAFPDLDLISRLSYAGAGFVMAPVLIATQFTVHNGAAVLFPAWVPTGTQRPRGLDAMGQRIILFGGVILALIVMVGPGAIAGGLVTFVLYQLVGPVSFVPGAAVCFAVAAVEVVVVTEILAGVFDRIDLTQVERSE